MKKKKRRFRYWLREKEIEKEERKLEQMKNEDRQKESRKDKPNLLGRERTRKKEREMNMR